MKGAQRKHTRLQAQEGKQLYEGFIITDERNKQPLYDGAGYLFNNETKCFFKGTWQAGEKVCGIETFPNGDVFEGSYVDSKFSGLGLLYNNVRGTYRYEGYFLNGQKEGQGKEIYITGGSYEGSFKANLKHGHGQLKFIDGSYYVGDFQRGMPNGFGLHVAYSKTRIVAIFPIPQQQEEQESQLQGDEDEQDKQKKEYLYEGDFVDGYKHGIGRLYEPSGSYFYGYWEYNKPARNFIYYEADGNRWKLLNFPQLQLSQNINFYEILHDSKWRASEYKAAGYPNNQFDGYKCMIDEKGLKRENFEDPEFDFTETLLMIRDENGSPTQAPVDYIRIFNIEYFKKNNYQLFNKAIEPGYLNYQEQYCCQQLTCVLDTLTYHSYLFQKVISRKYESEIGFYFVKLFIENEWKEIVIDDLIPVFKADQKAIFSNSQYQDLGWIILFKVFAKINGGLLNYFEQDKIQRAQEYLSYLTGMPSQIAKLPSDPISQEEYTENQLKFWKILTEKYQKTQVRIAYLNGQTSSKLIISQNYAYHVVDTQISVSKKQEETHFILMKSLLSRNSLKTDISDPYVLEKMDKHQIAALTKMKERNPHIKDDSRYFFVTYRDFLRMFENVTILCATKYTIQSQQLIRPNDEDKYNNELRFFCKFAINLPQSLLISVIQEHTQEIDENLKITYNKTIYPIRLVLAKEKDLLSNKSQVKKKVANHWQDKAMQSRMEKIKSGKLNSDNSFIQSKYMSLLPQQQEKKKEKPYKYIFGRGQSDEKQMFKDITLESGVYVLFIQAEIGDGKDQIGLDKMRFWLNIYAQSLIQIQKQPQIQGFQRAVYESAVQQADKASKDQAPKFYHKGDLSEQENGSSDLVITQYFLKKEGTYLQHLNNRSNNKIWRQKLSFRLENMQIIDQRDNAKLDLQLSKKETALVIIQQVGAKQYNLEGGEGICIVDLLNDVKEEDQDEKDDKEDSDQEPNDDDKPIFAEKLKQKLQLQ